MVRKLEEYSQDTYNSYMKDKDYEGLANYLDSFDIDDEETRLEVHNTITSLREMARVRGSIMTNKNANSDAINFTEDLVNNGKPGRDTSYGRKYSRLLNKIGSKDNRQASALEIEFRKIDDYNNFLTNIGKNEEQLKDNGIEIRNNNGINSIYFNKSNTLLPSILNSIDFRQGVSNFAVEDFYGAPRTEKDPRYIVKSYDYRGLIGETDDTDNLYRLKSFTNRISDKSKKSLNDVLSSNEFSTRTTTSILSPFSSAGMAQLQHDYNTGKISPEEYGRLYEKVEKSNYNLLDGVSLVDQDEVYVKLPKANTAELTKLTDSKELEDLTVLLHQALDEGRVKMQAALVGNKTGTFLTINAKNPRGANNKSNEDISKGKVTGETVIFVPNLLQGECEEAFNRDTKTRATKEKWNLQTYEYPYQLDDGGSIRYTNVVDGKGNIRQIGLRKFKDGTQIEISDEEVINELNRQFIKDEGVFNLYYSRKENNFYKTHKREDFDSLKEANPDILEYCKAAMEELFPGVNPQSEQYEYELQKLFDEIYNKLKNYKL